MPVRGGMDAIGLVVGPANQTFDAVTAVSYFSCNTATQQLQGVHTPLKFGLSRLA